MMAPTEPAPTVAGMPPFPRISVPARANWPDWSAYRVGTGVTLHLCALPGKAMAAFQLFVPLRAPSLASPAGLGALTLPSVLCASRYRDAYRFAGALERLGARVSAGAVADASFVTVTVPATELTAVASLIGEALREPALHPIDIDRVIGAAQATAEKVAGDPTSAAMRAFRGLWYRPGSVHHAPPSGDLESLATVDNAMVAAACQGTIGPASLRVVVAADDRTVDAREVWQRAVGGWATPAPSVCAPPPVLSAYLPGRVGVAVDGARRSVIVLGRVVTVASLREAVALEAAATALGGWYGSVLHAALRAEDRPAHGIDAGFTPRVGLDGEVVCEAYVSASVEPTGTAAAASALTDAMSQRARDGLDPADARRALTFLVRAQAVRLQTAGQIVREQARYLHLGHKSGFGRARLETLLSLSESEVSRAARMLHPGNSSMVIAYNPRAVPVGTLGIDSVAPSGEPWW
jgi:predicted Zn-dependent peptidase